MSYDPAQVAFLDTETTGLDPERHYVWDVAVIVDGVEWCWQQRIPGRRWQSAVDDWVLNNTLIASTYNDSEALTRAESLERLSELTRGRHLVGACPWFDSERLHRARLAVFGLMDDARALPWHYHLIDIETLVIGYMRGQYFDDVEADGDTPAKWDLPWKSDDLSRYVGVDRGDFQPEHTALADARWAKAVFEAVMGPPR